MRSAIPHTAILMCFTTLGAFAQTPLQPLWVHTWPFGNGDQMLINQPAWDNHVAVDPTSGHVFMSIDDQNMMASERWEFLFSFAPDGTEITPDPAPLLGNRNEPAYLGMNLENTRQLEVFAEEALQAHRHGSLSIGGVGRSFVLRKTDGTIWQTSLGTAILGADPTNSILMDAEGSILGGSADGTTGWLCAVPDQSWPLWARSYEDTHPIFDMLVVNGIIYAASRGSVLVVDRATGQLLDQWSITPNTVDMQLATDGDDLYYAWAHLSGVHWGKRSFSGDPIWEQEMNGDFSLSEMKVDDLGRAWMGFYNLDPSNNGLLLISTADGSANESFSYGASVNDIDISGDQAYLTGWLDTTSTETYLIAVSTDMNVGTPNTGSQHDLVLGPNPASDMLFITSPSVFQELEVFDAAGRTVLRPAAGSRSVDITSLSTGSYWLLLRTTDGTMLQRRFAIAR